MSGIHDYFRCPGDNSVASKNTELARDRFNTEEYKHNKESNMYRPFTILFFILLTLAALAEMGYLTLG